MERGAPGNAVGQRNRRVRRGQLCRVPQTHLREHFERETALGDATVLIWDYVETNTGRVIPYAGSSAMTRTLSEFWTLGKRDRHWIVLSIEGEGQGKYHLTEPLAPFSELRSG